MQTIILAAAVAVVIWLIIRSLSRRDLPAEECAKEVIQLLKQNQQADAEDISRIFQVHQRTKQDIGKVTRLINSRLTQARIRKDDKTDVMQKIRKAKHNLPD